MACTSQAVIAAANTYTFPKQRLFGIKYQSASKLRSSSFYTVKASSEDSDCNVEECAPDKEVGKISVEWLAGEKTKVVGTFPPRKRGWTGYVEEDTAGQKNIYSVEPVVYVAESAISSGNADSSSNGAENTVAITAGLALIFVAAASSILLQVGKNTPQVQTGGEYSGPSLSFYVNKFKPQEITQASVPGQTEPPSSIRADSSAVEAPQIEVKSEIQPKPSTSSM